MKDKIYVHVADDHKIVIDGIIAVINTDKDIEVREFSLTGKQVVDWFDNEENKADVLILDITMPILDGIGVLKHFKKNKIKQKVIILSSYDDVKIVNEMLKLGCKGYITKNNAGEHIIEAIKAVAKGEQYFSDDDYDSLMTVNKIQTFLWDREKPINYDRSIEKWPRTQVLPELFEINSGFFINSRENYLNLEDRIGRKPYLYVTEGYESVDVDWPEDFQLAAMIYKQKHP